MTEDGRGSKEEDYDDEAEFQKELALIDDKIDPETFEVETSAALNISDSGKYIACTRATAQLNYMHYISYHASS
jgi:hypothetical protein